MFTSLTKLASGEKSIVKTLASKGKFNTFITALNVAGLANHLDSGKNIPNFSIIIKPW